MIDAGVLTPEDHVELIDGDIVTVTLQKSRHATAVRLAETALRHAFCEHVDVRTQLPLALDAASEPEPDVTVVAGSPRDYRDAHPSTALLVVEVADASLLVDRTTKASLYARAGIPDYWLLNLVDGVIEVHRNPQRSADAPPAWRYGAVERYGSQDRVAPLARPDRFIAVQDLLP
jgi:Uma2 family endonuclease